VLDAVSALPTVSQTRDTEIVVLCNMDIAVHWPKLPHCYWNSRAIWDHTVLPATRQRWHSSLYAAKAGTQFSDSGGMQGWVDLVGWLRTVMVYLPKDGHPSKY